MSEEKDPHVMGSKEPERDHVGGEPKYSHWMDKELKGMARMERTEFSSDERAFKENRAGMQGEKNPHVPIQERERGDASAKARDAAMPFEGEEFDVDQFDRGDEGREAREEGEY